MTTNDDPPLGQIDQGTTRYLHLTKSWPNRHFSCDSCGQEYQSATFYSLATSEEHELPYYRVYCENCLKKTPAGRTRLQPQLNQNPKDMPKKSNQIKKNHLPTKLKPKKLPTKITKTNPPKSTHDYYCCCAEKSKQGLQGTKITQLTSHCKQNAKNLALVKQQARDQEKKKILANWKQIGASLGKIIDNA